LRCKVNEYFNTKQCGWGFFFEEGGKGEKMTARDVSEQALRWNLRFLRSHLMALQALRRR
jgi:hypothetical protein